MRRILGTGNDDVAGLNVPTEDNLSVALAVLLGQLAEHWFLDQRLVAVAQRIPRLNHDALAVQELLQRFLLRVGVDLRLEDGGLHFADGQNLLDLLHAEIGQSNGPDLALFVRFLHEPVSGHIVTGRLMDQQQVDVVRVQTLQRLFHSVRLLVKRRPQLGFQEDFFTLQTGLLHGPSHGPLVDVGVGGVDQTAAACKGADAGCLRLIGGQQEGSNASQGHFNAVIQFDGCAHCLFLHK